MKSKPISLPVAIHPIMNLPEKVEEIDLTKGYHPERLTQFVENGGWGAGGYCEKRENMYLAGHFGNRRNVHMGIDIWAAAGEPVFAPLKGRVAYVANRSRSGDYGGTLILKHSIDGEELYALYGHLSPESISHLQPGDVVEAGQRVGELGTEADNGNWPPHLHYQVSRVDPGEADMPGVVEENDLDRARSTYPDPRPLTGLGQAANACD
jgi:peptidoglycan LD-endopeptidase LytH